MLHELPFHDELSTEKISKAFKGIGTVDSKVPSVQLTASESSIKNFRYQITVKVLLKKYKEKKDIEFASVYFNSTTKTVINSKYDLDKSFQEIIYRIDNWINEGSGWMMESINGEYVNISI